MIITRFRVFIPIAAFILLLGCAARENAGDRETRAASATDRNAGAQAENTAARTADTPASDAPLRVARVGKPAPDFTLADTEGKIHRLSDYTTRGKVVVLEWFNPDCPFVQKQHKRTRNMIETQAMAAKLGVVWLAVNSNAPGKQGSGLERNRRAKREYHMEYPLLMDEDGHVGRLYRAKTTPEMYLIDANGILVYQGAIDNNPSPDKLGTVNYVKQALSEHAAGKPISDAETKSYGCSVKYAS
jgi:peroxiredoxin